jgi:hypothetical protein
MHEIIKFPKSFDFSTPFEGQRCAKKEEIAHAGALHNEAIVQAPRCHLQCPQPLPMMICSPSNPPPPRTKTPAMRIKKTKFKTDQGAEFKPNSMSPINEAGSKIATSSVDVSPEFPI